MSIGFKRNAHTRDFAPVDSHRARAAVEHIVVTLAVDMHRMD